MEYSQYKSNAELKYLARTQMMGRFGLLIGTMHVFDILFLLQHIDIRQLFCQLSGVFYHTGYSLCAAGRNNSDLHEVVLQHACADRRFV